jgi:aminoglycoside/choline kinase family phosphotransferase
MEAMKMNASLPLEGGKIDPYDDPREHLRKAFLAQEGLENNVLIPLPSDASKRRYFRLSNALLMDAPPPHEKTTSFQLIADLLHECDLSVPRIYAADHLNGFLLIEDLGELPYRKAIQDGVPEALLYGETVQALTHLHQTLPENGVGLSTYDLDLFLKNACLYLEWYDPSLGDAAKVSFQEIWDVMVDNLLWLPEREGFKRSGFIDFQDGVWGPVSYDLVSLLEDSRREISPAFAQSMIDIYLKAFPDLSPDDFWESYCLWGAQRSVRILGVFARLSKRDGKPHYMDHCPRIWKYLERDLAHPKLTELKKWFDCYGSSK